MKKENSRIHIIFFIAMAFIIVLFCLRAWKLDVDFPMYGVGAYHGGDEGLYANMAINLYHYGSLSPDIQVTEDISVTSYTAYHLRSIVVENLLVYCGLRLFGNNYTGFRIASVAVSLVNFLLILHITWLLLKRYGKGKFWEHWIMVSVGIFYTISFPYLMSSRAVEPTIVRLFFALLVFDILLGLKDNRIRYCAAGFLTTLSVGLAYVTQIFLYIPIFFSGCVVGWKKGKKAFFDCALSCIVGGLSACVVCSIYYHIAWGTGFLENCFNILHDFSGVAGYSSQGVPLMNIILYAIKTFFSANTFLFHLPLLTALLLILPSLLTTIFVRKDEILTFCIMAIGGLLLQTCYTNDYIFRKAFLIQPFAVVILIAFFLMQAYGENVVFPTEKWWLRGLYYIYTAAAVLLPVYCLYYRLACPGCDTVNDFTTQEKILMLIFQGVGIAGVSAVHIFQSKMPQKASRLFIVCTAGCSILVNTLFAVQYVWRSNSTTEKDIALSLQEYSGHAVFGPYSFACSLYNDIRPGILRDKDFGELVDKCPEDILYIDISATTGSHVRDYFNALAFKDCNYTPYEEKTYERAWRNNGKRSAYALYSVIEKDKFESEAAYDAAIQSYHDAIREASKIDQDKLDNYALTAKKIYQVKKKYQEKRKTSSNVIRLQQLAAQESIEVLRVMEEAGITVEEQPAFVDVQSDVCGPITVPIYGSIFGDIHGNIYAPIYGDVYGDIYGAVSDGMIYGEIYGRIFNTSSWK